MTERDAMNRAERDGSEAAAWHRHLSRQADREGGAGPTREVRRRNARLARKGLIRVPAAVPTVRIPALTPPSTGGDGRASRTERRRTARKAASRPSDDDEPASPEARA
jgi:hypothetical protein